MKKTLFTLFAIFAMVLIGCSQPTGGDIPDWENPPSEIGGGDSTDPAEPENPATKFTVTFKTAHGKNPASIEVEKDTVLTAEQLKKLTFEGFIFKGWFDGETEAKAGEYKVTKDVTLTAKWKESSSTGPDPVEPENPVTDPESDPVDPVEPEDPAVEPENPVDPEPEKSPYEELLKDIENATRYVESTSTSTTELALEYLGTDVEPLEIPDDVKKSIIAKFIEKLPEDGNIIGYGYILEDCTIYCYTDKYFVGFKAVECTKLTSEDLSEASKDFKIFKKSN